ncbi:MAG: ribonuclease P protein component [Parvularculaceae bacterium]
MTTPSKNQSNQPPGPSGRAIAVSAIKKRQDFLAMRGAPGASSPAFLMLARANPANHGAARIGLTVTKKIGGAVVRNRIRRRLRAAAREIFPQAAQPDTDYVLIARKPAVDRNYALLLDDMKRALLRLSRSTI